MITPGYTLWDIFTRLGESESHVSFFTGAGWENILAWNPHDTYLCTEDTISFMQDLPSRQIGRLLGYLSYDAGEVNMGISRDTPYRYPLALFHDYPGYLRETESGIEIVGSTITEQAVRDILSRPPTSSAGQGVNFIPTITREYYARAYTAVKRHITCGNIYQVNLTHQLEASVDTPSRVLFTRVAEDNDVEYLAYIESSDFDIISASPESFVQTDGPQITTSPIKGTRPRSSDPIIDNQLREELLRDEKETAELNMITDLLRNDIGKIAQSGTVSVVMERAISPCPTVWHTYSTIIGELAVHPLHALLSMMPGGSVTGCPKKRAMEIIRDLEAGPRGIYCGSIGQITEWGDISFSIAIRTIVKNKDRMTLGVGGGIVYDSSESAEFEETLLKSESFQQIL